MTLSTMGLFATLSVMDAEFLYAEFSGYLNVVLRGGMLSVVILNVFMLSVVAPYKTRQ
jgi:hypothetical protein